MDPSLIGALVPDPVDAELNLPAIVLETFETYRGNAMIGVPTMLIAMLEHPTFPTTDLSSVKAICSGGSTVPAPLVKRFEEKLGARLTIVFGQTECSPFAAQTRTNDSVEDKANTIGLPLPNMETKIVDPNTGETAPIGTIGEFCTRGYHVMLGYFEMPDATAAAIDADGWLHTGDLCAMDARGYCTVEGRLKDMIIRGGENIFPRELEELLFKHPKVGEVAVIGVPHEKWGEEVAAFIRPAPGTVIDKEELTAYMRASLAPHKTPKHWFVLDAFALTGSGKISEIQAQGSLDQGRDDGDLVTLNTRAQVATLGRNGLAFHFWPLATYCSARPFAKGIADVEEQPLLAEGDVSLHR